MTALENVQVPMYFDKDNKEDREARAYDLLCKVGLKEKVNSYPAQMSGGEQQRVAIAIALANNPKILLADEPTGAVDSKTSDMIQDLFRKLNEEMGITVIIVTHDISLANKVGRVVMIADGKISTEKIITTRPTLFARLISCVTMITVIPISSFSFRNRSWIISEVLESTAPVGSSANRILGLLASAIAIATLCCSPPDICAG